MNVLLTFETISAALNCEGVFKKLRITCNVIPFPRKIGTSCNYAIATETDDVQDLCVMLKKNGAEYKKVFQCVGKEFEEIFFIGEKL
ncbi:MAG: hypothetical protein Ta2G_13860 [Termitinemataceae bacterium]|nr:MAG: hypothetical protein Ta2G_13860 [Termitinemataceae bacterium]